MIRNPIVTMAADMLNAVAALKLKSAHRLVNTSDGLEIHQPGKPVLLLTYAAAADFAQQMAEAEHG